MDYHYSILQKNWLDVPKFWGITTFTKGTFLRKQELKPSPSFPVDSSARSFPPPDREIVLLMNVTYGRKCATLLPDCGLVRCLGTMLLVSSIWGPTKRFLTCQKRDTLFFHSNFRLVALAHGMSDSEFLSWRLIFPTPLVSDKSTEWDAANMVVYLLDNRIFRNRDGRIWSLSLSIQIIW